MHPTGAHVIPVEATMGVEEEEEEREGGEALRSRDNYCQDTG